MTALVRFKFMKAGTLPDWAASVSRCGKESWCQRDEAAVLVLANRNGGGDSTWPPQSQLARVPGQRLHAKKIKRKGAKAQRF